MERESFGLRLHGHSAHLLLSEEGSYLVVDRPRSLVLLSGDKFHIDDNYVAGYFANDPDSDLTPYRNFVRFRRGSSCTLVTVMFRFNATGGLARISHSLQN